MTKAECDLLGTIEAAGLQDRFSALNSARDQASFYAPEGTGYSSAHIEMKLSHFYMVAAPERLEY